MKKRAGRPSVAAAWGKCQYGSNERTQADKENEKDPEPWACGGWFRLALCLNTPGFQTINLTLTLTPTLTLGVPVLLLFVFEPYWG
jgi:hypothetical protein